MRISTDAELTWDAADATEAMRHPEIVRLGCGSVAALAAQAFLEVCTQMGPGKGSFACARELAFGQLGSRERAFRATAGYGMSVAEQVLAQLSQPRGQHQQRQYQLLLIRSVLGQLLENRQPVRLRLAS